MKVNTNTSNIWLLLLRVLTAAFMLTHGWPKFQRLISGEEIEFGDPLGVGATASLAMAAFAEFFCSILIGVGFRTRLATIPLLITMGVAAFIVHGEDPFGQQEKALLYILVYMTLLVFGGGKYSLDRVIWKR